MTADGTVDAKSSTRMAAHSRRSSRRFASHLPTNSSSALRQRTRLSARSGCRNANLSTRFSSHECDRILARYSRVCGPRTVCTGVGLDPLTPIVRSGMTNPHKGSALRSAFSKKEWTAVKAAARQKVAAENATGSG